MTIGVALATISSSTTTREMKGEYVPPGLTGSQRNKYREAVHRYKKAYGLSAADNVPKDILDQIAEAIKNGESVMDAADNADPPPEGDDPPTRKDKRRR